MREAVMRRIETVLDKPEVKPSWPTARVVWRAGELRLSAVLTNLHRLVEKQPDAMTGYCLAWALGRIGDARAAEPLARARGDCPAAGMDCA